MPWALTSDISGTVVNNGTLAVTAPITVFGDFTQTQPGRLDLDLQSPEDVAPLTVSGDISLGGELNLSQSQPFFGEINLIDGSASLTGNFDNVYGLIESGLLFFQEIEIDAANADVNLVTGFVDAATIGGLSFNEIEVANSLTSQLKVGVLRDDLAQFSFALATQKSLSDIEGILSDLSPEIVDSGIQNVRNTQMLFTNRLLNVADRPNIVSSSPHSVASRDNYLPNLTQDKPYVWGDFQYSRFNQSGGGITGFETDGYDITTGIADMRIGPILMGIAAGYGQHKTDSDGESPDSADTEILRLGAHARSGINAQGDSLNAHIDTALSVAWGRNKFEQNITAQSIGIASTQGGETDISSANALLKLTLDGKGGEHWKLKPYILLGAESYTQDGFVLGDETITTLEVQEDKAERYTMGYGASFKHEWDENTSLRLSATGLHHRGDTRTGLVSHFAASTNSSFNFPTIGKDISEQYLIDVGLYRTLDAGWVMAAEGFTQFGDLKALGGRIQLRHVF